MFLRILGKDLKRKKTMNLILLLFVVLAAMFVASGLNNVVAVMEGTNYFLDAAGVGDYVVLSMGEYSIGKLDDKLSENDSITKVRKEPVIYGSKAELTTQDGKKLNAKNTVIYQDIGKCAIKLYDSNNQVIQAIKPGHAYATGKFLKENDLHVGDTIHIDKLGEKLDVVLDGKAKDAFLGSELMGNIRILLSKEDMASFLDNEEITRYSQGEILYLNTSDPDSVTSTLSDCSNVAFSGSIQVVRMSYVMDMIIAFIILILSICLIIVSFVVLKFSITLTLAEEFREIGVMKAIGIGNFKIRGIYLIKYFLLAALGAAIGLVASIPFGDLLLKSVSENIVLGKDDYWIFNLIGAVFVVAMIVLFAFRCTAKVKKVSPIDAIHEGQTGERYESKSKLKLSKSKLNTAFFMALNDVLSAPKRFLSIMIVFCLCASFVLILVNTTETMNSDSLIDTFGIRSDLYINNVEDSMNYMVRTKQEYEEHLKELAQEITDLGMPCKTSAEIQYKYKVISKGKKYSVSCQQGMNCTATDYKYTKGLAPESGNEIAVTPQMAKQLDANIGDIVTVDFGSEQRECIIVGYFQSMNLMGMLIRLHEEAPTDFSAISSMMPMQIDFTDAPSEKEIENRKESLKKHFDNDEIMNATEYCVDCMGVLDMMKTVQGLLLFITSIVVILMTILMERSFISDERSQIAILKAMGFSDGKIIAWQVYRFGLVGIASVLIAVIFSIPLTHLCISPVFAMMGATDVKYVIRPLQIILIYPGVIWLVTVISALFTALYTKSIKCNDTSNIE